MTNSINFKPEMPMSMAGLHINDEARAAGTDNSQAITQAAIKGVVTSSTVNLEPDTGETIIITNGNVNANSHISVEVSGGGDGSPMVGKVTPTNGSFTVEVRNINPFVACNAAYKIHYLVF